MKRQNISRVIILSALLACSAAAESDTPAADVSDEIPYSSLDEALRDLHSRPSVVFRNEGGWIVAYDDVAIVSWLLTPKGHPAYPSIVKRHIVNSADSASMATEIRCFASKATCDKYFGGR
jgi:hypothetical protein